MRLTLLPLLLVATIAVAQQPDPVDAAGWFALGNKRHDAGDPRGAIAAYEKATELNFQPRPTLNMRLVRSLSQAGEKERAFTLLQQMTTNGFSQADTLLAENDFIPIRTDKRWADVVSAARKNQHPCASAPEYRQFDFWLGEWDVEIQGHIWARSSVQLILDDCTIFENYWTTSGSPYAGKSFSVWDARDKRWEQNYADTNGGARAFVGGLEGEKMVFYLRGQGPTPASVNRMTYTKEGLDRVRQTVGVSTDDGKTWSPGFDGLYIRRR